LRAVAFCTNIDKPVANVTLSATPTLITRQRRNLGSTRSCGIETDSDFRIRRNFRLSIGYLFVDARVKSFSVDPMLEGSRVPQVPRHQITLQARYSEPKIVSISINLRAATSQFDDDQNQFRLGGFGVVDLFASKRFNRNFELYLAVENLFDTPIESGRTPILTLTNPRAFRVGLRLHFGRRN
jgi:outer membrane receptor protein involved in Fe transport